MTPATSVKRFLGLEIHRYDLDGNECATGTFVILRMRSKIAELFNKFKDLIGVYNCKAKPRYTPGPKMIVKEIFGDGDTMSDTLNKADHDKFRQLVGGIMWVTNSYRWDMKFVCFVLTLWMHRPRKWDMYIAVWALEYLHNTLDVPLVLGGPELEVIVYSDASFATLPEARSPKGHLLKLGKLSGAVACEVHCVTMAIKSVYESELITCSEGFDTAQFVVNVLEDLKIEGMETPKLCTDSESVVAWINGANVTTHSRHLRPKYYNTRHVVREGLLEIQHIAGESNPADLLTKILPFEIHWKHVANIMGHGLIKFALAGVNAKYDAKDCE